MTNWSEATRAVCRTCEGTLALALPEMKTLVVIREVPLPRSLEFEVQILSLGSFGYLKINDKM